MDFIQAGLQDIAVLDEEFTIVFLVCCLGVENAYSPFSVTVSVVSIYCGGADLCYKRLVLGLLVL